MAPDWQAPDNKTFESEPLWPFNSISKNPFASLPQMWFSPDDQVHTLDDSPSNLSTHDLKDAFRVRFTFLREKHHIDRLVQALYLQSSSSSHNTTSAEECARTAFLDTTHVLFPRPTELQSALRMARGVNSEFLTALLTNSDLRFRLCILAHLFESALALDNGVSKGEHPRELDNEEMTYVIKKMQNVFLELFKDVDLKDTLQNFLDNLRDLVVNRAFAIGRDHHSDGDDKKKFEVHALIKYIFPVLASIQREFDNLGLERESNNNTNLRANAATLWTFIKLSLTEERFICNPDYKDAAMTMFKAISASLNHEHNSGPAMRLLRDLVRTADQLWDGGKETYSCLAMERIYAYFIRRSLQRDPSASRSTRLGDNIGFSNNWDMMQDFQSFVQSIARNIAPVPVPGIAWKGEGYEMNLDSVVLNFPKFSQRNIQLSSSMIYDAVSGTLVRTWNLKISGVEVVAENVQYFFATTSALFGRIADSGEMNLKIPEDCLELEFSFTISAPKFQEHSVKTNRQTLDQSVTLRPANFFRSLSTLRRNGPHGPDGKSGLSAGGDRRHKRGSKSVHVQHNSTGLDPLSNSTNGENSPALNIIQSILHPNVSLSTFEESKGKPFSASSLTLGRPGRRLTYANRLDIRELYEEPSPTAEQGENDNATSGNGPRRRRPDQRRSSSGHDCITINTCLVDIRRLDVDVVASKRPLLLAMVKGALVDQFRKSIEQTILEAVVDVIDAANEGIEHVSHFTEEDFEKRHGGPTERVVPKLPTRFSWNGDRESSIYAAYPVL